MKGKGKKTIVDRKGVERCRRCGAPTFNCVCRRRGNGRAGATERFGRAR